MDQHFSSLMKPCSAKIILFGEYSVLNGSKALAIPFLAFSGKLIAQPTLTKGSRASAKIISELFDYLRGKSYYASPRFEELQQHITQGLYFESNIPNGYGLGSSGALVAALYAAFFTEHEKLSIQELKSDLAGMESYFHGTSSGIDPLVSFLNEPVMIHDKTVETIQLQANTAFQLVLIDTGQKAATQGLVQHYKNLLNNEQQKDGIKRLKQMTNRCIDGFLQNKLHFDDLIALSNLQQGLLKPMFVLNNPLSEAARIFKNDASLKLCGSGGGGFISAWVRKSKSPEFIDFLNSHKLAFHLV